MSNKTEVSLATMKNDIDYIKERLDGLHSMMKDELVTKYEFSPVRNLVYGATGLVLLGVITAIVRLIMLS